MTVDPSTIKWSGGTNYLSYFSDASYNPAPSSMAVTTGVPTDQGTYSFIIDPMVRTYTIKVSCAYLNPDGTDTSTVSSQLTFTSVAPTVSLTAAEGKAQLSNIDQVLKIQLKDTAAQPTGAGMRIDATTTTQDFGGTFMFLQLIQPMRFTVDNIGGSYYWPANGANGKPNFDASALDNSYPNYRGAAGYPIANPQSSDVNSTQTNWELNSSSTETHSMGDSPYVAVPANNQNLQVGRARTETPEKFHTYVMYRPWGAGVWVAIGKVDWEWSGATLDRRNLVSLNTKPPKTTAPVTDPSDYFPGWTDSGTNILGRGKNFSGSPGWKTAP